MMISKQLSNWFCLMIVIMLLVTRSSVADIHRIQDKSPDGVQIWREQDQSYLSTINGLYLGQNGEL